MYIPNDIQACPLAIFHHLGTLICLVKTQLLACQRALGLSDLHVSLQYTYVHIEYAILNIYFLSSDGIAFFSLYP